ncbi:MAG: hypothetical protein WDZ51_12165 [Pirellulaceae bacterium]
MRRILIAAAVVAGMTMATSSAMAQGRYYGGTRGVYRSPVTVQVGRRPYYRSYRPSYSNYRSGYYRSSRYYSPRYYNSRSYRGRSYYRSPSYYRGGRYYNRSGFGIRTPGFSFGIGF